jgi:AcrR family transcriptional regulator
MRKLALVQPTGQSELTGQSGHTPDSPRHRLVAGLATALVEKGYAATTIADIVRHARVSKRTFYEHFADKEECFLAAFANSADYLLRQTSAAAETDAPWPERVHAAVRTYLTALQAEPALTKALLLELPAAGSRALALRRRHLQRFADLLHDLAARVAVDNTDLRPLSPATCTALIGGINELTLVGVEEGRAARLADLVDTAADLIQAALRPAP